MEARHRRRQETPRVLGVVDGRNHQEEEILRALDRKESKTALTLAMQAYGDALYRYCCGVLGDPTLAQDVHQTTFIQAYKDMDRFSRRSSLRAWLYGIARHRCLDALKSRRRSQRRFELTESLPDEDDPAPLVDERIADQEVAEVLEHCLQKLKPQIRIAVLLRFQENFSYEEMARACHERPATLQARVARAMPLLRRCIEARRARS